MFQHFFNELRAAKVPVTLKEYLTLLEAMDKAEVLALRVLADRLEHKEDKPEPISIGIAAA